MDETKLHEILKEIDLDPDLNDINVIEKIKDRISPETDDYREWAARDFDKNHRFHVEMDIHIDHQSLLLASCKAETQNIVKCLIGNGVDVNLENKYGSTPLYWAVFKNNIAIVDMLLKSGADVNKDNMHKCTPIMKSTNLMIVKKLVGRNAEISNLSQMKYPISEGAIDVIKFLIEDLQLEHGSNEISIIISAAKSGSIELLNYLSRKCGININTKNEEGMTALHAACTSDSLELVKFLVENKKFDILAKTENGETPFCYAAKSKNLEIFKYLYKRINCEHDLIEDERILQNACLYHLDNVKYLIEELGVPFTHEILQFPLSHNKMDIMEYLLNQLGPITKKKRQIMENKCLLFAINVENHRLLRYLIERKQFVGNNLEETAVEINSLRILKYLLKRHDRTEEFTKVAHLAAQYGRMEIVKYMIEEKYVTVDDVDDVGHTMLHFAAMSGSVALNKYLVTEKGADIHKLARENWIPLYYASSGGHLDLVRYYIEDLGMNFIVPDLAGWTPLYLATVNECHFDVVKYLVEKGSDVNVKTDKGRVPIQGAVFTGHLDVVKYLLEHGASLDNLDQHNHTPLCTAVENGHFDLTKFLIEEQHLDHLVKDIGDRTILHLAVHSGNFDLVKYVYELVGVSNYLHARRSDNRWTPMHEAIHKKYFDIAVFLISKGARVNTADQWGNFPIHLAAKKGDEFAVGMLILKGSNVNPKNGTGYTPLHLAVKHGHLPVVKRLFECGANIDIQDKNGNSSLDLAMRGSFPDIVEFLRSKTN